jgi:hypothetical protein
MLQIGTEIVPVYVTDRYVIAGEMFADRKQITRETQEKLEAKAAEGMKTVFLGMKDDLAKSASIVYTPKGKVKQRLFMFGTTQCPWCSKAAKETQHGTPWDVRYLAHPRVKSKSEITLPEK